MRLDAHQHFWHYTPANFPWITGTAMEVLRRDYLPHDLEPLLKQTGFDGTIAVQAQQNTDETAWLLEQARHYPFIRGVVGWVDLQSPTVADDLVRFTSHSRLVGIRHIVHDEPDDEFLLREAFMRGVSRLSEHGLTYDLLLFPKHLPPATRFVDRFPHQPFVLDHIAKPRIRDGVFAPWEDDLRRLADRKNVSCKLSGMVTEARWGAWRPEDFHRYLDIVFEAFGPERLMIGSDWPVCTLSSDYASTMKIVTDYVERFPPAVRDAILGGNGGRIYSLDAGGASGSP